MFLFFASFACPRCTNSEQNSEQAALIVLDGFDSLPEASWNQRFQATDGCTANSGLCGNLFPHSRDNDASWDPQL